MKPSDLEKDRYVYMALQGITGYTPVNEESTIGRLTTLDLNCQETRKIEVQKEGEYKAARDNAVKAEHDFHDAVL
jgi:hypothetical protein